LSVKHGISTAFAGKTVFCHRFLPTRIYGRGFRGQVPLTRCKREGGAISFAYLAIDWDSLWEKDKEGFTKHR
jgi:hypothetical protein